LEADERELLDRWIDKWSDIVDFEVFPVLSSEEAAKRVASPVERPTAVGYCRLTSSLTVPSGKSSRTMKRGKLSVA
jgi:Protein of unknown function (DUF3303)